MTSEERAALRKLHAASTRGEWHYVAQPDPAGADFYGVATDWDANPADPTHRGLFVAGCLVGPGMTVAPADHRYEENPLFIAAAHQAVPALLDDVDRLEAEVAKLRQAEERLAGPLRVLREAGERVASEHGDLMADRLQGEFCKALDAAQAALEGPK